MGKGSIENRVRQQQDEASPYNMEFRLGGLYDSRVGSASGGGDEDEDTALAATWAAGWQAPLAGDLGLRVDYTGYADFHQEYDEYDVIDQGLSLEPQYRDGPFIYSLPLSYNFALEDGDEDYGRYAVSPTLTFLVPDTRHAVAIYGIAARMDDRDDDKTLDEDGEGAGGGLAYLYSFENRSRVRLSADYQHTQYDARVADYGTDSISTDKREDDAVVLGLDAVAQFTPHMGLYMNYSFIHSNANVLLYEYDRQLLEAGVVMKF